MTNNAPTARWLQWLRIALQAGKRLRPSGQKRTLVWAAVAGLLGGGAALGFRFVIEELQLWFLNPPAGSIALFARLNTWERIAVPAVGGLLAGLTLVLGRRLVRGEATDYMEVIAIGDGHVPVRASIFRSLSALLSISSGEAIGREGPMVQMAAAIASLLGRWLRVSPAQLRLLVACGAAAGIASAYNAPIAGALFVAEIVLGSIAMECFGPLVLASVMASLVMRTLHGSSPLYELSQFRFEGAADLLAYAVLGALCGAVVPVFHWTLQAGRQIFSRFKLPLPLKLAVGGVVVGLLAISHPEVTGNGATVIHALIGNELAWDVIATLLIYKLLATSATFGSGAVGGVFTPALLMGACIGSLFAMALGHLDRWEAIPPASCAVIGMAAFLAGATRAPLMSILMIFEMTLNSSVLVPVMTASVLGYYVARSLGGGSLYNEQLREAAAGLFGRPVTSITVGQLMRKPEPALSPESEFREIARRFVVPHAEWVPVSGIEGQFLGIVLRDDVENNLSDTDLQGIVIAGDLLRPAPVQLSPRTTLLDAIKMVTHANVEDAPVVGSDGKLIGVLGKNDLLIALSQTGQRSTAEAKPAE